MPPASDGRSNESFVFRADGQIDVLDRQVFGDVVLTVRLCLATVWVPLFVWFVDIDGSPHGVQEAVVIILLLLPGTGVDTRRGGAVGRNPSWVDHVPWVVRLVNDGIPWGVAIGSIVSFPRHPFS